MSSISLSVPSIGGNEWKYVKECLDTEWVSSAGKFVGLFEEKIADYTGAKFAIACVNGTSALQVSLRLAGVSSGNEVILPTLTFIAPVNAVAYNGASPIFMDSDEYYNIDTEKTIEFINNETVFKNGFTFNKTTDKKITAILPVHVWGNAAWMDELILLCAERNIAVVEDACESLGTFFLKGIHLGKHTGTIGTLGCLSFNGNKIITTGGGGMILTNDESLAERARYLTTQAKDDPLRYTHNEIGYNFRLTNIQAAIGVAQLEQLPSFLNEKRRIHQQYIDAFENIEGLKMVKSPQYANNNHWMNLFQIADQHRKNFNIERIMLQFKKKSVETRPVWLLNHLQFPYKECQNYKINNAHTLHKYSLCVPSSSNLSDKDFEKIVNICKKL
jgi:perosamine synthetase